MRWTRWTAALGAAAAAAGVGVAAASCNVALGLGGYFGAAGAGAGAGTGGSGQTLWARSFGDDADQSLNGVAVGPDGHVFITGQGNGFTGFGCPAADAAGSAALGFLVELDAEGACVWTFFFGGGGPMAMPSATGNAVAVDPGGHIVLAATFSGQATLPTPAGPWQVDASFGQDAFVVRFEADHTVDWVRVLTSGGGTTTLADSMAATADEIVVGVQYTGSLQMQEPPPGQQTMLLQAGSGGQDVLAVVLDANGAVVSQLRVDGPQDQTVHGIAARSDDAFAVSGQTTGPTSIGGMQIASPSMPSAFFAVADAQAAPLLQGVFAGDASQIASRVALDDSGSTFLLGEFQGDIAFADGGPGFADAGNSDVYVTGFRAGGHVIGALEIGSEPIDGGSGLGTRGLRLDGQGGLVFGGSFSGHAGFPGAASVTGTGTSNAYVAKVDTALTKALWLRAFADPTGDPAASQGVDGVAVDGAGNTVVAGHFTGSIDCGGDTKTLVSRGQHDVFVAKLSP
jgi:hypothetical protein